MEHGCSFHSTGSPCQGYAGYFLPINHEKVEPDEDDRLLFKRAGKIHENGIRGYSGWGYKWKPEEAEKLMLRTHTTASTMRSLHRTPKNGEKL